MPLCKVKDILKITGGRLMAGDPMLMVDVSKICTDTRTIRKGDIFLALSGSNFDGNDFSDEAFKKDALGAIVSCNVDAPSGKFVIKVKDAVLALQQIASYHRSRFRIPVIAITGSNGKTTVKDMIWTVLSEKYNVLRNEGTKNNHIGVPQTLLKLKENHDICVIELGTNHKGEIGALGRIVRPTLAVITNIGPSHLEFLEDLKGVFKEKAEILSNFQNGSKHLAVINGDDPYLAGIKTRNVTIKRIGFDSNSSLRGGIVGRRRNAIDFRVNGKDNYVINLLGDHNVCNAMMAVEVGKIFKVRYPSIRKALYSFRPTARRLDLKRLNGYNVIDDSYNSNPLSMQKALEVMRVFPAASKWVVSGDMLELGPGSVDFHKLIGEMIARSSAEGLVTMGELSRHTFESAHAVGMVPSRLWHCSTHDEIADILRRVVKKGDVILIKGSRSMRMEKVLEKI